MTERGHTPAATMARVQNDSSIAPTSGSHQRSAKYGGFDVHEASTPICGMGAKAESSRIRSDRHANIDTALPEPRSAARFRCFDSEPVAGPAARERTAGYGFVGAGKLRELASPAEGA